MYITIWIFIIIMIVSSAFCYREHFAGAMVQMYAKGPEDIYLTSGTEKYIPPYFYSPSFIWNNPTRLAYPYYYPLYGIYPNYAYGIPTYDYAFY